VIALGFVLHEIGAMLLTRHPAEVAPSDVLFKHPRWIALLPGGFSGNAEDLGL